MEGEGNGSIYPIRTQTERRKTMIVLQLLLYCLLFTAMVKIAVIGGAVNGLYFYPKTVQDQAIEWECEQTRKVVIWDEPSI